MHLFGLTGGIASGKTAVANRLRALGLPVIDADGLSREVMARGTPGLAAAVEAFGPSILDASGALDRKQLGRIVFSDPAALARLNAIAHPRIAQLAGERALQLSRAGEPLACYEAALLVENGLADAFRPLVVVSCPETLQESRLRAREGISEEEAWRRIRSQKPLAEKERAADFVVDTSGSMHATEVRVDEVLRAICEKLCMQRRYELLGPASR